MPLFQILSISDKLGVKSIKDTTIHHKITNLLSIVYQIECYYLVRTSWTVIKEFFPCSCFTTIVR